MSPLPNFEDRGVILLDQPNGSAALLFDLKGGHIRTTSEYDTLFTIVKETGDVDERNSAIDDALASLADQGYFFFAMEYPGVPANGLDIDGDIIAFDGDEWNIVAWLETDLPIA